MVHDMDNIDRGILHLLQVDARNTTAQELADKVGASASTIRNRIDNLEDDGVIIGYHPEIDYEEASLPLRVLFVVTAPPTERSDFVEKLLDVKGVVDIREMLTGKRNIHVEVVGTSTSDVTRMTDAIHELGLEIEQSEMIKQRQTQPFNHFHYEGNLDTETDESG